MFSINKPKQRYVLSEIIKEQMKYQNKSKPLMAKDLLNIPYIDNSKIEKRGDNITLKYKRVSNYN